MTEQATTVFLNSKVYDKLKFIVQIFLPALATFYLALAGIWGLPNPEQVVGTITAVTALLGVTLGISSKNYNQSTERFDGSMVVTETPGGQLFSLEVNDSAEELAQKTVLTFKVVPESAAEVVAD